MAYREHCSGCIWAHDCKGVYEALGGVEGPSVVWKVIVAFLLPILIFVVCLMGLDKVLAGLVVSDSLRIILGVLGSGLASLATVLISSRFARRRERAASTCHSKEIHDQ